MIKQPKTLFVSLHLSINFLSLALSIHRNTPYAETSLSESCVNLLMHSLQRKNGKKTSLDPCMYSIHHFHLYYCRVQ
ncbi:hypothetical protein BCR43DRAFT_214209 [Syncephalastrum racemosum]|uniref:Secreted protein n=1 Tax=Syncephalastrum racemosum TaxID=13706 RepID=A0A1X2HIT6_SYNRA|nr:hypothetical protein BCR43DRAFT_214209 [Syncephalastrum racemosum]